MDIKTKEEKAREKFRKIWKRIYGNRPEKIEWQRSSPPCPQEGRNK